MSNAAGCAGIIALVAVLGLAGVGVKSCFFSGSRQSVVPATTIDSKSASVTAPTVANSNGYKNISIPRTVSGDKGRYIILEYTVRKNLITILHKRIGVDSVGYTRTVTNCATMKMKEVGYIEFETASPDEFSDPPKNKMPPEANSQSGPSEWFPLVEGSSKSDMAVYACSHFRR